MTARRPAAGPAADPWVIIVTGADGTQSVTGTFPHEYAATLHANTIETMESGMAAQVTLMDAPEDTP